MDRETSSGAMPWRYVLDAHPPRAHWSFFVIWCLTASLGPIAFLVGVLDGSGTWWMGEAIYGVALVTIGIDWLVVRRLRRDRHGWRPWQPPRRLHSR